MPSIGTAQLESFQPPKMWPKAARDAHLDSGAMLDRESSPKACALLCTSNGAGLGHLSRAMAIGRELQDAGWHVIIWTMSRAIAIPTMLGFHTEYFHSRREGESSGEWNAALRERLVRTVQEFGPSLFMFDGVFPYNGVQQAIERCPDLQSVWLRRGMWKPGVGERNLELAERFDHVFEPGEYAAAVDVGPTASLRGEHFVSGPIRYIRDSEVLSRSEARHELSISDSRQAVLLQLGAGAINSIDSLVRRVADRLHEAHDVEVFLAQSVISAPLTSLPEHVRLVSTYPLSRYFNAFDAAVMASGYNSFHEALSLDIPTLFVPNLDTKTDDQQARARWASAQGLAECLEGESEDLLFEALEKLVDPTRQSRLRAATARLEAPSGAAEIAQHVRRLHS